MEETMKMMNRGIQKSPAEERTQFRKDREKFKAHQWTNVFIDKPSISLKFNIKNKKVGKGHRLDQETN